MSILKTKQILNQNILDDNYFGKVERSKAVQTAG
jgi:hypothetical protein